MKTRACTTLVIFLLGLGVHQLPAPIQEVQETPPPNLRQSAKPKPKSSSPKTPAKAEKQGKTLKFPKGDPQFTVTFENDWKAEITDGGVMSAQPQGGGYALSIFPVEAKSANGAVQETLAEVEKRFENIKSNKAVEFKTTNNVTFLERDFTAKDKGAARALAIIAFTPNGKRYYALFQAGTPEADKRYTAAVVTIVKSIKSLTGSNDSAD